MNRKALLTATLLAFGALHARPGEAKVGLAAKFGDVILEGVQPGRTYSLREAARVPFGVQNRGDAETTVVVEFDRPRTGNVSVDYEAIPDPTWLKAVPDRLTIPPGAVGFFDLLLTVPDDSALKGRHFQVMVKARGGEGMFGVAVENRVRFSVGQGPGSLKEEKKRKAMQQLDFDISPKSLFLTEVPLGRSWDARKEAKKSVRIANFATDPLTVTLSVDAWDRRYPLPEGYEEIPDTSWVKVKMSTVTVESEEIATAGVVVEVPDKPEHRGKRWAATLKAGLLTGYWLDSPVRLLVETVK